MATTSQYDLVTDLQTKIGQHRQIVEKLFQPLDEDRLSWQATPTEWNVLQCFDHLNLTHSYYRQKIDSVLGKMPAVPPAIDTYTPSFWGRIYMFFALNPNWTFSAPAAIAPRTTALATDVLTTYLQKQRELQKLLIQVNNIHFTKTLVTIEKWVKFNLGDCLKILVYHDALHIRQAQKVLSAYRANHL